MARGRAIGKEVVDRTKTSKNKPTCQKNFFPQENACTFKLLNEFKQDYTDVPQLYIKLLKHAMPPHFKKLLKTK